MKNRNFIFCVYTILVLLNAGMIINKPIDVEGTTEPIFTLVAKTNGGGVRPDILNFVKQHLARIGIGLDVIVQDWGVFVGELLTFRDFDICYVGIIGGGADPDFSGLYSEDGALNMFGYNTSMDWDDELGTGLNEWYMKEGQLIMPPDSSERLQHYWDWQQHLMDKILPCQPTFVPKNYMAIWSNLDGYNITDGVIDSFGKMEFTGLHTAQEDSTELVIADDDWQELNPFFYSDGASALYVTLLWIR